MYQERILENNLTVVYEKIPHVRSVSFGVWIGTGSRYETPGLNGISHFIEHMMFKGTESRTARDIAMAIDHVGGQINAFTGKECTCFYTRTLDEDLETAVKIISDMLFHSTFEQAHMETEKRVIAEEISMYEDYPEEMVHDILTEEVWSGNALGYPILGNYQTIAEMTREKITDHIKVFYVPENSVISIAGHFDEEKLMDMIKKYFGQWKSHDYCRIHAYKPWFNRSVRVKKKDTEQVHMCMGFRGVRHGEESMYSLLTLNNILGGGMSSRLFQKVREELGLAYSIYSYPTSYRDVGMFTIYAASNPKQYEEVIRHIQHEIGKISRESLSEEDVEKAKSQLKGSFLLGLEGTGSRMNRMGKSRLIMGEVHTPEQVLERIKRVSVDSISEMIRFVFRTEQMGISAIGDIEFDDALLDSVKF